MVETHVVNTFLAPTWREAPWFGCLNWCNGLIAPAFLFIAGYAQTMNGLRQPIHRDSFFRKARRLLEIAALGYALHVPFTQLGQHQWAEALRCGTQVDVLPCLAVSLLGLLVLRALFGMVRETWRTGVGLLSFCAIGFLFVGLAPASAGWDIRPIPFAAFLNDHTGSLFPLFPWAAFVFVGAVAGALATRHIGWLVGGAAVAKCIAVLTASTVFSALSPSFFCDRLAWVLLLAVVVRLIAKRWTPSLLLFSGRESLTLYAVHLIIIGRFTQAGMFRDGLGWGGIVMMFASVLVLTFAVAFAKARWQKRDS